MGTIPYLAPAGRHVYSRATCLVTKAPEGRHVIAGYGKEYLTQGRKAARKSGIESVGVGLPNPLGEAIDSDAD